MSTSDKVGVAMIHYICPVCEKPVEQDSEIMLNTRLTKTHADKVKAMHNKNVGYAKRICDSCHDEIGDGIYLVGVIEEKTDDKRNPYRSGKILGITKDAFERIFDQSAPKGQVCWAEHKILIWIETEHSKL